MNRTLFNSLQARFVLISLATLLATLTAVGVLTVATVTAGLGQISEDETARAEVLAFTLAETYEIFGTGVVTGILDSRNENAILVSVDRAVVATSSNLAPQVQEISDDEMRINRDDISRLRVDDDDDVLLVQLGQIHVNEPLFEASDDAVVEVAQSTASSEGVSLAEGSVRENSSPLATEAIAGIETPVQGRAEFSHIAPLDENRLAGNFLRLTSIGTPIYYELLNPTVDRFRTTVWSVLTVAWIAGGVVAAGSIMFFTRRALRPIHSITAAFRSLGEGDLSQRVTEGGVAELSALSSTYNDVVTKLANAEESRRQFSADTAHELKTPLTNIRGYVEAIQDGVLQPEPDVIDEIHHQTEQLTKIVEDLRFINIADVGRLSLNRLPGNISMTIREAVQGFENRAKEQGVALEFIGPDELLFEFDAGRIRQVINNLVDNALNYTPREGRVTVKLGWHIGGDVAISVRDTGEGISKEDQEHIFERFYRADPSRTGATGGSGLGLTIVKKIVERHPGTITVASDPGVGTEFSIRLLRGKRNI